jgi:Ca2+-dependent lipid-binding protein
MDPFCTFEAGDIKVQTSVKTNAGKTPVWNETFSIRSKVKDKITFAVYDEDPMENDLVGQSIFEVSELLVNKKASFTYPIFFKEAKAGEVTMELIYHPSNEAYVKLTKQLQEELTTVEQEIEKLKHDISNLKITETHDTEVQRVDPNKATQADLIRENQELLQKKAQCDKEIIILENQLRNQSQELRDAQLALERAKIEGQGLEKEIADLSKPN